MLECIFERVSSAVGDDGACGDVIVVELLTFDGYS